MALRFEDMLIFAVSYGSEALMDYLPSIVILGINQPAVREACGRLVPRLFCCFRVCMCVRTYHMHNNYVTYIGAMRPY